MSGEARCWYLNQKGKATGPYILEELTALAAQGKLKGHDLVFRDGASEWKRGYDWPELVSLFSEENRSSLSRLIRLPEEERAVEDQWVLLVREDGEREVRFRQRGPFPADEIRRLLLEEKIKPSDHIWKKGAARWVPLYDVPEFQAQNLKMTVAAAQTLEAVASMPEMPQVEKSEAIPEISVTEDHLTPLNETPPPPLSLLMQAAHPVPAKDIETGVPEVIPERVQEPLPPNEDLRETSAVSSEVVSEPVLTSLPEVLQAVEGSDLVPSAESAEAKEVVSEDSGLLSYDEFIKREGIVALEPVGAEGVVAHDLEEREISASVAVERMPLYQVTPETGNATPVLDHLPTDGSADEEIPAERLRDDFEFAPIHRLSAIPEAPHSISEKASGPGDVEMPPEPALVIEEEGSRVLAVPVIEEERVSESVTPPMVTSAVISAKNEKSAAPPSEKPAAAKQKLAPVEAQYDFKPPQTFFSKMAPAFMVVLVALFGVGIWATIRTDKSAFQGRENSAMAPQPQIGNPMVAPSQTNANEAPEVSADVSEEPLDSIPSAGNGSPISPAASGGVVTGTSSASAVPSSSPVNLNAANSAAPGTVPSGGVPSKPGEVAETAPTANPALPSVAGGPNAGIINAVNGAKPAPETKAAAGATVAATVATTPAPAPVNPAVDFDGRNPIVRVTPSNFIEIMGPFRKGELLRIRMEGRAGQILEVPALVQKYEVRVAQDHYYRISIPESKIPRGDYSVNVQFGMNRFAKNLAVGKDAQFVSQLQNYRKTISFEQQQERKRLLKAARDLASILAKSDSSKDPGVLKAMQKDLEKKIPKEVKMVRQNRYELIFFDYWEKIAVQWERVQTTLKDGAVRNPASITEISRAKKAANSLEAEIRSASIWTDR